jgi:hypothetical protein
MELPERKIPDDDAHQTRRALLFGIAVWFLHLNTIYALPSLSCKWNWFSFTIAGIRGLPFVEGIITILALVLLFFPISIAWKIWRKHQTKEPADNPYVLTDTEKNRHSLAAFIVMSLNCFFFLFAIANFIPMIALNACSSG